VYWFTQENDQFRPHLCSPAFTTDYPYSDMEAARQFFDQMPISVNEKEKIAHLNAERLVGRRRAAARQAAE